MDTPYIIDSTTENLKATPGKVNAGRVAANVNAVGEYEALAVAFLKDNGFQWRDRLDYVWCGTHYRTVPDISTHVSRWLTANRHSQTTNKVNQVTRLIRAWHEQDTADYPSVPCWLNGGTGDNHTVITFADCLYDLDADKTLPHTPDFFSPYILPYAFLADAICPNWDAFLADALDGDSERIGLLQEWFGYLLSGSTSRQRYLNAVGPRASGKSVTAFTARELIGNENSTGLDLRDLASRFGPGSLRTKSLAVISEVELTGCKDRPAILGMLKSITGQDAIKLEYKGVNVQPSVVLPTRFHISSNTVPDLRDSSGALARRPLFLPFFKSKPESQQDRHLTDKLRHELPGICQWALQGLRRLNERDAFTQPAAAQRLLTGFEDDSSPVLAFLRECCVVSAECDNGTLDGVEITPEPVKVRRSVLFAAAARWFGELDKEFSADWFSKDLRGRVQKLDLDKRFREDVGPARKQVRYAVGIDVKPDVMPEVEAFMRQRGIV